MKRIIAIIIIRLYFYIDWLWSLVVNTIIYIDIIVVIISSSISIISNLNNRITWHD